MRTYFSDLMDFYHSIPEPVWFLIYSLWLVSAVIFIVMQRRSPVATLGWIVCFFSLPLIGAVIYFFFGPRRVKRRQLRRGFAKRNIGRRLQQSENAPVRKSEPEYFEISGGDYLSSVAMGRQCSMPRRASYLELYADGDSTFAAIEATMRSAQNHIHLEYYIFEPDIVGKRWLNILCECARSGVTVRVLLDALGSINAKKDFWHPLIEAGGMLRYFNPPVFYTPKTSKLNFRTHRKIVIIDGQTGFTGGVNVDDKNSALINGANAWRDTHIRVDGSPVQELQYFFLEDWEFADDSTRTSDGGRDALNANPADFDQWFPAIKPASGPWVQIVGSGPDASSLEIQRLFFRALTLARHRIWITTPYFVPDEAILTAIVTAVQRGVDVQIIIPTEGDSKLVRAAASTYAAEVYEAGARVWTFGPRMNHAKTMVIDDTVAIVGTANLDNRSFRLNFEVIAVVFDKTLTSELAELFKHDLEHCTDVADGKQPGFVGQLIASAARLFSPLL